MKRRRFDVMDRNGATLYPLHGVAITAHQGLVELHDINSQQPGSGTYIKAIISLGYSESVVEVAYEVPS
jgi:hypothetical protein